MAKQPTGHVRWFNGVAVARIRVTRDARESFAMPSCKTEAEAAERARLLAEVARRVRRADVQIDKARTLLEKIAGASPRLLRNALAVAGELIGGELRLQGAPRIPTFDELGDQWTKGELAQRYPDQVRMKRSADDDKSRLTNYVYPVLKDIPIDQVTVHVIVHITRAAGDRRVQEVLEVLGFGAKPRIRISLRAGAGTTTWAAWSLSGACGKPWGFCRS